MPLIVPMIYILLLRKQKHGSPLPVLAVQAAGGAQEKSARLSAKPVPRKPKKAVGKDKSANKTVPTSGRSGSKGKTGGSG